MPDLTLEGCENPTWDQVCEAPDAPETLCFRHLGPYKHLNEYYTWYQEDLYSLLTNEDDPNDINLARCKREDWGSITYTTTPLNPEVIFPVVMMELVL